MKYILIILVFIALSLILGGAYYDFNDLEESTKHSLYGFGTLLLFFVCMPLFLFYRRDKTNIKKYIIKPNEDKNED